MNWKTNEVVDTNTIIDGVPNAAVVDASTNTLRIFTGEVVDAPMPPEEWRQAETASHPLRHQPTQIVAEDLDLDGDDDLIISGVNESLCASVTLYMKLGGGAFGNSEFLAVGRGMGTLNVADILGDDRFEIVFLSREMLPNGALVILTQTADDTPPCPADFDGDGVVNATDLGELLAG